MRFWSLILKTFMPLFPSLLSPSHKKYKEGKNMRYALNDEVKQYLVLLLWVLYTDYIHCTLVFSKIKHNISYNKIQYIYFEKILTFSLARGFDLVLSLGVTTPLITPVMDISWPSILGKECFDLLKSIGFGDLVRLFSSLRRSDRVYLGWFVWDSVWRLFRMQASRGSVKAH